MKRKGPDSLQSWLVAGACCFINMMIYGVSRLVGIMFVASMTRFNVGREIASFPYTFSSFIAQISGPLVGYTAQKISVRTTTAIGCALAAIGCGACYFADVIVVVIVLWGLVFGIGLAFSLALLPVAINQHFHKKRVTASGISYSGVCIGTFVLPPITDILINNYGLSGTFLVLSGLIATCIPAALVLSKPDFEFSPFETKSIERKCEKRRLITDKCRTYDAIKEEEDSGIHETYAVEDIRKEQLVTDPITISNMQQNSLPKDCSVDIDKKESLSCPNSKNPCNGVTKDKLSSVSDEHNSQSTMKHKKRATKSSNLLCDPIFYMMVISVSLYKFMLLFLLTIIVDFSVDIGVEKDNQKYLLMFLSGGELVGRLGLGWVTDGRFMSKTAFMALSFFGQALSILGIGLSTGFNMLGPMLVLHGLTHSGVTLVFPPIIADFISEEKQAIAISSSTILAAPLTLSMSPLIGFFRENLGSYEYIFFSLSVLAVPCGILWLLTPCIVKCRGVTVEENN